MNAAELLTDLAERGIQAIPEGEHLRLRPRSALTPELIQELRTHKAELLVLLDGQLPLAEALPGGIREPQPLALAEICAMPLEEFAKARLRVVVHSKVLGEEVLFASDNATIDPGERRAIYRAAELQAILGAKPGELASIHAAKKAFGANLSPA